MGWEGGGGGGGGDWKNGNEIKIYSLALYLAVGKMGSFSLMTLGS